MPRDHTLTRRVLVLGFDTQSFLSVIRSLGRAGLEVHVAWCPKNSPSLRSRYVHRTHLLPEYRPDDRQWLDALLCLMRREKFDIVIPCHDSEMLPLQMHRQELEAVGSVYLLSEESFRTCFSKHETYVLAARLGIKLPKQIVVHSLPGLRKAVEILKYPIILKPRTSASERNPQARRKVLKALRPDDLESTALSVNLEEGVLVQENFNGIGVGVEVLCHSGEILVALQHERVHEPLHGGGSSYRKTTPLNPELLEATRSLMQDVRYTGVAMVEFKVNSLTGAWILVEINARFWGSLPLSLAAGVDFPRYLYEMLCQGRTSFPTEYRPDIYCRNWGRDLYWQIANLRADHSDPHLLTRPLGEVARELGHVFSLRESSDTLVLDDPRPAVAELREIYKAMIRPKLDKLSLRRRYLRNRARRAARRARVILFLCKGNICRSPFAEYLLAKRASGLPIRSISAGFYPVANRHSPAAAIQAAGRWGVRLEEHRSRVVDAELIGDADMILVFDRQQIDEMESRYPEALSKTHYLGSLDDAVPLEIADPYGADVAAFESTYMVIENLIMLLYSHNQHWEHSALAKMQEARPTSEFIGK